MSVVSFRISIGFYMSCHSCVYLDMIPMPTSSDLYYAITHHIYLISVSNTPCNVQIFIDIH